MNCNYIIRKVSIYDAEQLLNLLNEAAGETDFLSFEKSAIKTSIENQIKYIENVLEKENCIIFVCELDNQIIGMIDFSAPLKKRMKHVGEFGMVVLKEYWGKGIGNELVKALINWAKNSNIIRKINLRVRNDNNRAIELYYKVGFLREGYVSREFLINGLFYDVILMGKNID